MQHPQQTTRGTERSAGAPSRSLHLTRLPAYLAAGVGAAGLATSAEAQIVSINLTNLGSGVNVTGINAGLANNTKVTIQNWLGAGTGQLELYNNKSGANTYTGLDGDSYSGTSLEFAVSGSSLASPFNFSSGASIGPSSTFTGSANRTTFKYNSSTSADFGSGSYMGFRFSSGASFKYGWLEVTWNSSSSQFQILSGAYQNSLNTPILAGDSGSTPIPESTASGGLMGLLLGGAALRQWRKSRNKADVAEKALSA